MRRPSNNSSPKARRSQRITLPVPKLAAQIKNYEVVLNAWGNGSLMVSYEYLDVRGKEGNIENPTLSRMVRLVEKRALLTTFYAHLLANSKTRVKQVTSSLRPASQSHASFAITTLNAPSYSTTGVLRGECPECSENHTLPYCSKFKDRKPASRLEMIKCRGLCFNCLDKHHTAAFCSCKDSSSSILAQEAVLRL